MINLQQFQGNLVAVLVATQSLLEDFFSLRITAIGNIDIGLGKWIHFIGVDAARASLVKVSEEGTITRIN